MKQLISVLIFCFALSASAQDTALSTSVQDTAKGTPEATKEKQKVDSITSFPVDLTEDQEKQLKEYDDAPAKFQKAFEDLQKEKLNFILNILKGRDKNGKPIKIDVAKLKDYEHKKDVLILKLTK